MKTKQKNGGGGLFFFCLNNIYCDYRDQCDRKLESFSIDNFRGLLLKMGRAGRGSRSICYGLIIKIYKK